MKEESKMHYGSLIIKSSKEFEMLDLSDFIRHIKIAIDEYVKEYEPPIEFMKLGFSVINMPALNLKEMYDILLYEKEKEINDDD